VGVKINKRKRIGGKQKSRKHQMQCRCRDDAEDSAEETESDKGSAEESDGAEGTVRTELPQTRGRGRKQAAAAAVSTGTATDDAAAPASSNTEGAHTMDGTAAVSGKVPRKVTATTATRVNSEKL
jgi:hypothetical protein